MSAGRNCRRDTMNVKAHGMIKPRMHVSKGEKMDSFTLLNYKLHNILDPQKDFNYNVS